MFLYLILFLVSLFYIHYKVKFGFWKRRGIDGPPAWPVLGTMLEENFTANAEEIEEKYFKKFGKVFGTFAGTTPIFNTSVPEHIKAVLMDPDTFNQTETFEICDDYIKHSMVFKNGSAWKSQRMAASHHFTSRNLRSLLGHFKGVTNNFLNNVDELNQKNEKINVKPLLKCYGVDCVSKFVFAIDCNSFKDQSEWVQLVMQVGDVSIVAGVLELLMPRWLSKLLKISFFKLESFNSLGAMFSKVLQKRSATDVRYHDLAETLQAAIDNGLEMTENAKIGNCLAALFGGVDTVSNALCKMVEFLVEYPEIQERLYTELKSEFSDGIDYERLTQHSYLDAFCNESLRLAPPVYFILKRATKDTKLGNFEIEKGVEVLLNVYQSQRSPDNYVDPKKFDPERFMDKSPNNPNKIGSGTFLPFSAGNRHCLGKLLASLEIKYLLVTMLLKYELKKPKDFKIEADHFRGGVGIKSLPIIFEKRQ